MDEVEQRIKTELEALGFNPHVIDATTAAGLQRIVSFEYRVPTGRFKSQLYTVGIRASGIRR